MRRIILIFCVLLLALGVSANAQQHGRPQHRHHNSGQSRQYGWQHGYGSVADRARQAGHGGSGYGNSGNFWMPNRNNPRDYSDRQTAAAADRARRAASMSRETADEERARRALALQQAGGYDPRYGGYGGMSPDLPGYRDPDEGYDPAYLNGRGGYRDQADEYDRDYRHRAARAYGHRGQSDECARTRREIARLLSRLRELEEDD